MRVSKLARFSVAAAIGLAGCGAIYTSPKVTDGTGLFSFTDATDYRVEVIPLSFDTALEANLSPYVPARLPAFLEADASSIAGAFQAPRGGANALMRLPPPLEPTPYRIGVADMLLLSANPAAATLEDLPGLISSQSKRQGYVVQDDGAIAVPDVGRIRVAGLTLEEAEARIFEALVQNRFDPTFSLEIAEFNSQRVSIGGGVGAPVVTPLTMKPLYLHEALQLAGGVETRDPDYTTIKIYRDGGVYQVPLLAFYSERGLQNILLKDGDSIYVDSGFDVEQARLYIDDELRRINAATGINTAQVNAFKTRVELGAVERGHVYLTGEVRKAHRYPLPFENRANLADVMFSQEGLQIREADYGEIYVLRAATRPEEAGGVTAFHLDAANAANLAVATQFEMRPGDVVFVAEQPVTTWNRVVSQIIPTLFTQIADLTRN